MNTGKIITGIGFLLSFGSMMMFEVMQAGGSFMKGVASGSYLMALIAITVGMVCIVIGLARSYEVNQ